MDEACLSFPLLICERKINFRVCSKFRFLKKPTKVNLYMKFYWLTNRYEIINGVELSPLSFSCTTICIYGNIDIGTLKKCIFKAK